jgi:integrase
MAKVLSAKAVAAFKADPKKRQEIPDRAAAGLYLVVQPSGSKSWAMRYRFNGKPAKLTLGTVNEGISFLSTGEVPPIGGFHTLAEARELCAAQLRSVIQGIDPAQSKVQVFAAREERKNESSKNLVENVITEFLKRHVAANELRSATQIKWLFGKHVTPVWKGRDIRSISKRDVIDLVEAIADTGRPIMANRVLAHVRKLFSWAEGRDIIDRNPSSAVAKPGAETSRSRVLSQNEIKAFWQACDDLGQPFGNLFKFLLLTAQRRDEAAQMIDDEIVAGIWTVPALRAKNGVANLVPLSKQAREVISKVVRIGTKGLIFTTDGDNPVSGFSKAKLRLDTKMFEILGAPVDHFVIHDLRRTAATNLAALGFPIHISEAVLNHKSGTISGMVAIYNRHDFADEKRNALQVWADSVDAIVGGKIKTDNIIELIKARD